MTLAIMKKISLCIFLFVSCLFICACAKIEDNAVDMDEESSSASLILQRPNLPKSEIMFLDIEWGMPESIAIELTKERFPDVNFSEEESYPETFAGHTQKSENFHDPQSRVFSFYSSQAVKTKVVKLLHQIGSGKYSYTSSLGTVAGYPVNAIYLYFVNQDGQYLLYKAAYSFGNSNDIEPIGQFADLQDKMTKLYGTPETYTYDESVIGDATNACAVWDAGDSSAAYLEYTFYFSGYLSGVESVWLCYGTLSINDYFIAAEDELVAREKAEQQERIDIIKADDSGL